jgi:two-component sensor histidine kinase
VVSLALCLHELATNAAKYGALSRSDGKVAVTWRVARRKVGGRVHLEWSEHDGPPVIPPKRQGFGSRLLRQGLSNRARPTVEIDYAPDGLRWTAEFDVEPETPFKPAAAAQ